MTIKCLRRAFRCYGGPIAILSLAFIIFGIIGVVSNQGFGPVFMIAGIGALAIFTVMGARCNNQICPDCC